MARPVQGPRLVEKLSASEHALLRLKLILETIAGQRTAIEAAEILGITEQGFHKLRMERLQSWAEDLEPKPTGRKPKEDNEHTDKIAELEAQIKELKIDLKTSRLREEIALSMPHLLTTTKTEESPAQAEQAEPDTDKKKAQRLKRKQRKQERQNKKNNRNRKKK